MVRRRKPKYIAGLTPQEWKIVGKYTKKGIIWAGTPVVRQAKRGLGWTWRKARKKIGRPKSIYD